MDSLSRRLEEHMDSDEKALGRIEEQLRRFEDNHLAHIEPNIASLQVDIASIRSDVNWLMKIVLALIVPVIGGFVGIIYQVITKR